MTELHIPDEAVNELIQRAGDAVESRAKDAVDAIARPVLIAELRRLAAQNEQTRQEVEHHQDWRAYTLSRVVDQLTSRADELEADHG